MVLNQACYLGYNLLFCSVLLIAIIPPKLLILAHNLTTIDNKSLKNQIGKERNNNSPLKLNTKHHAQNALARRKFDLRSHVPSLVAWPYYEGVTKLDGKGWWDISSSPPAAERNFRFLSLWFTRNLHGVYAWCLKLYMW